VDCSPSVTSHQRHERVSGSHHARMAADISPAPQAMRRSNPTSKATGHMPGTDASEATQERRHPYADDVLVVRPQKTDRRSIRSRAWEQIGWSGSGQRSSARSPRSRRSAWIRSGRRTRPTRRRAAVPNSRSELFFDLCACGGLQQ
jgi:hypothetical protein